MTASLRRNRLNPSAGLRSCRGCRHRDSSVAYFFRPRDFFRDAKRQNWPLSRGSERCAGKKASFLGLQRRGGQKFVGPQRGVGLGGNVRHGFRPFASARGAKVCGSAARRGAGRQRSLWFLTARRRGRAKGCGSAALRGAGRQRLLSLSAARRRGRAKGCCAGRSAGGGSAAG